MVTAGSKATTRSICLLLDAQEGKTPPVPRHIVLDPTTPTKTVLLVVGCQIVVESGN